MLKMGMLAGVLAVFAVGPWPSTKNIILIAKLLNPGPDPGTTSARHDGWRK